MSGKEEFKIVDVPIPKDWLELALSSTITEDLPLMSVAKAIYVMGWGAGYGLVDPTDDESIGDFMTSFHEFLKHMEECH